MVNIMFELLIVACTLTNNGNMVCEEPITSKFQTQKQCDTNGPLFIDDMVTAGWIERGFAFIEYTCNKMEDDNNK